ncbi:hypothetical protein [Streptomyces sp. A012304]|uniref:hypothetical protein n=1 Tax=Streptomyces sp. A012304 TaxID=375446 RepID=UPI002231349C|nr:hypothetical protein [Streptomyces sp. A012304]GKQ41111.1 hypothetical protein ALMP_76300 [Streptomyces sp. A012304]
MRPRTAALVLRLPLRRDSPRRREALGTLVRAAVCGASDALSVVTRIAEAEGADGAEALWRVWLTPSVSGRGSQRWASAFVAGLLDTAAPVPARVVDAAWTDWLHAHHPELWSLLERYGRPATEADGRRNLLSRLALGEQGVALPPALLAGEAVRFDHPIGDAARARLLAGDDPAAVDLVCRHATAAASSDALAFCLAHRLAPSDEVQRALFFARTRQRDQYWALDPDGALLALGYRTLPAGERASLREAITALGGVDVLRVLAGQGTGGDGHLSLTEKERAFVVGELAQRQDWDRLWSLVMLMPLPEAVDAARHFGDREPPGHAQRRVVEALRAADPAGVRGCAQALGAPHAPHSRVELAALDPRIADVHDVAFSPDGTRLAFAAGGLGNLAGVIDVRTGALERVYAGFTDPVKRVTHLGSDTLLVVTEASGKRKHGPGKPMVHRADPSGIRPLDFTDESRHVTVTGVDRVAGDRAFAVTAGAYDWDGNLEIAVFVAGPDGPLVRSHVVAGLAGGPSTVTAVRPDGRMIAVLGGEPDAYAVVADLAGSGVTRLNTGSPLGAGERLHAAMSPSALVRCTSRGDLRLWHAPFTSAARPRRILVRSPEAAPIGVAWSAVLDRFVAVSESHLNLLAVPSSPGSRMPRNLVGETITRPGRRVAWAGCPVRISPRGDVLAVPGRGGTVDLYFLALLRTCLEHRFRHDVEIGAVRRGATVPGSEIELGG